MFLKETYNEITGELIALAKEGKFDVIAHGCNCFCTQGGGIAYQMSKEFTTDDCYIYDLECDNQKGKINKLGQIQIGYWNLDDKSLLDWDLEDYESKKPNSLAVVNAYTQYKPGADLDYSALALCLRKIGHMFEGKKIGLPQIGCGIAGGDWEIVKNLIQLHVAKYCDVTVVIYEKQKEESSPF